MVTLYDVPTEELVDAVAERLRDEIDEPDWVGFAKTGTGAEFPPEQEDFFHRRAASVLRTVAVDSLVVVLWVRVGRPRIGRPCVVVCHRSDPFPCPAVVRYPRPVGLNLFVRDRLGRSCPGTRRSTDGVPGQDAPSIAFRAGVREPVRPASGKFRRRVE